MWEHNANIEKNKLRPIESLVNGNEIPKQNKQTD